MRKILIDSQLEAKVDQFCENLFVKGRNKNFQTPLCKLKKLHSDLKPFKNRKYRIYLSKIISEYNEILRADPEKMRSLIKEFYKIDGGVLLNKKVPYKNIKFYDAIVSAMRYEDLRDKEFLDALKTTNIKSCIYCNSQLTTVIDFKFYNNKTKRKIKTLKGKLELDHFHPKSYYPFLCTSFFNLYPVCGNCNRAKSYNPVKFELYTRENDLDVFNFWIEDSSLIKYWASYKCEDLDVKFEHIKGDVEFLKNHNETFAIQGIYETQKDLAEELVIKAKAYTEAYKENLIKNFAVLLPDAKLINRLIIGNYDQPQDIHKRPMSKYTQDIARQLKLI